ncbi:MAG: S9 family peptidase [Leadbetterella sp.]
MNQKGLSAPIAPKKPHTITTHGHTRVDNYFWLREKENKEVIDYLNAENTYFEKVTKDLKPFEETLFQEMKSRIKEQDESVPVKDGKYLYYTRYEKGGEYPIYCRKQEDKTQGNIEQILLNGNVMGKGKSYFNIGGYEVSDNDEILAYCTDEVSRRNYTLQFKNIKTGEIYPEKIENTEGGSFAWAADNKSIFYIVRDQQTLLGDKIYKHILGTDPKTDVLVYHEKDNQFYMGLYRSKSKKYVVIMSGQNGISTEYNLISAKNPTELPKTVLPRKKGFEYFLTHFEDKFYIKTNHNQSTNYQISEVLESEASDVSKWKVLIPHRTDVFIEDIEVFKNHLVVTERKEGLINIRIIDQKTKKEHYLEFNDPAYDAYLGSNPEFDTNKIRFVYSSFTTPSSTYDYDMNTKDKVLKKQQAVLGGKFLSSNYKSERIYVTGRDGVRIPVSLVYHKNTKLDGTTPLLQYAYGSYGYSMDVTFSSTRLSILDRGFVFAICHIRGGQEMGRHWYEDGKMFKKINTFNDFVDCSKELITKKYTSKNKLFAMGGSAGGLLMGAIINQASELYKGVVASVPFVDVVNTMLDETIPLTTGEFEEWGNPKNKESYDYILSYSPYDNVKPKAYPNMLVTTGLHDSQVQYWEPAKWVAKLRELKTNSNILLLKTDMTSGHGGASGRFAALKDIAVEYAFILDLAGKVEKL